MLFVIIQTNQLKIFDTYQYQHIQNIIESKRILLPEKYNVIRYNNQTVDDWTQSDMWNTGVNIFPIQIVTLQFYLKLFKL